MAVLLVISAGVAHGVQDRMQIVQKNEITRKSRLDSLTDPERNRWRIQSIDTMKESRDRARGKLHDDSYDEEIVRQVEAIAGTGANFIAIDTPYDEEFLPFLRRWIEVARSQRLHVWFRGNWSGWEGWFDYPKTLTRENHIQKTEQFIAKHPELFRDGDIFSPCPECENGGPGDPRVTGDVSGYRKFVLDEYERSEVAFSEIHKKVRVFFPSNLDIVKLVMNKETTRSMGGVVVIDHYIDNPKNMARDVVNIARSSGGKVVVGEFGTPLDSHSSMTDEDQALWIRTVLHDLSDMDVIEGVNYWIHTGGPTELWRASGEARASASVIREYFLPRILYGTVTDERFCPIEGARIVIDGHQVFSATNGRYEIRNIEKQSSKALAFSEDFFDSSEKFSFGNSSVVQKNIILQKKKPTPFLESSLFFGECQ